MELAKNNNDLSYTFGNWNDDKRTMSLEEIKNHEWTHNKLSEESKKFISELQIQLNKLPRTGE